MIGSANRGCRFPLTRSRASGTSSYFTDVNLDGNLDGNTTGGNAADNMLANCATGGGGLALPSTFESHFTYSQPLLGNDGACGRNVAREPGLLNFNWTISKDFQLKEAGPLGSGPWDLQLRAEAYNVFDTPAFYVASVNNLYVSNPTTFGQLTALPQRKMQMVIRLLW
ncbi:MAG: outer membrane beta-barrel protein [Candidatus Acidiferrales bacterium]